MKRYQRTEEIGILHGSRIEYVYIRTEGITTGAKLSLA